MDSSVEFPSGLFITRDAETQHSYDCRVAAVRLMRLSYDSQHSCNSLLLEHTTALRCSCGCLTTVARQTQEMIDSGPSLKTYELLQNRESIVRMSEDCLAAALRNPKNAPPPAPPPPKKKIAQIMCMLRIKCARLRRPCDF